MPETPTKAITEFWSLFRQRAPDLAAAASADAPVYDELLEALQRIDEGLYLELSAEPGACQLVITAEGDRSLFPTARAVVAAAPAVEGWELRALKPKLGFPEATTWGDVTIRARDISFEALEDTATGALDLRIFIPGITDEDADDAHNAVLRMMDHGVGEEALAEAVRGTEVQPLLADTPTDSFIALLDLPEFLDWRARRTK